MIEEVSMLIRKLRILNTIEETTIREVDFHMGANFIVHDVLENIEGNSLKSLIEIANESEMQYIVAILKEKLISSKMTEEEQERLQIIKLSDDDNLFERTDSKKVSEYL